MVRIELEFEIRNITVSGHLNVTLYAIKTSGGALGCKRVEARVLR